MGRGRPVQLDDFRALVRRLEADIPPEFQGGVVEIEVSPKTVPHPLRGDVYTLGECIPLEWSGSGAGLQSRVVLYHGSFQALSRLGDFDWREEAWETLTHELRHHLEWQADVASLEAYDWAAEQNFARHEAEPFDPVFYRNGEQLGPGIFKVDDDVFLERERGAGKGERVEVTWHGRRYGLNAPPAERRVWLFLTLAGLEDAPPGDAVLVFPGRPSMFDLLRGAPRPESREAPVERLSD
jgi:zinicin-like metallopeptidase